METSDIDNRFVYHQPSDEQLEKYAEIRRLMMEIGHALNALCPESREKALAVTNLEQSQFWANASIARHTSDKNATPK
jgi:hypothetical protein